MKHTQLLVDLVAKEVATFEGESIYIGDKVKYSQFETVKKILLHQNNGFAKPSKKHRTFFQIGNSRRDTCIKKIDFDTKDIQLYVDDPALNGVNLLLESELRQFLKDTNHGERLNEQVETFVDWGNAVAKEDDDEIYRPVNIANLKVIDQTAETLEDTTVIEEHRYTINEFRKIGSQSGWDNYQEVIERLADSNENQYVYVYERYGLLSKYEFLKAQGKEAGESDRDNYIQTISIVAGERPNPKMRNSYLTEQGIANGELLFIEELKSKKYGRKTYFKPYREAHYSPYEGRWLRKGVREVLFELQDRANELGNQIREAMKWSSIHVFWSPDANIAGKNIMEGVENGQIIKADTLAVLPLEERNLSAQVQEWNKVMDLADRETQSFEVATGEGLPSGTTLGQVQIQTAAVGEHFDFKREKLALFIKSVFNDWVLPTLIKEMNKEHNLEIVGSPEYIDRVIDAAAQGWLIQNYLKAVALSGGTLTQENWEELTRIKKEELMKQPKMIIEILQDTYKEILPKIDIVITGENINKQSKINNAVGLLNFMVNPMYQQDPSARSIIQEVASLIGFNVKMSVPQPVQPQPQPQGTTRTITATTT